MTPYRFSGVGLLVAMKSKPSISSAMLACLVMSLGIACHAGVVTAFDIKSIPDGTTGSGNGTLDLRMMTFTGGSIDNDAGGFDGDDANTTLPQGGGDDTGFFDESYVTTIGELRDFYILNFPDGGGGSTVSELVLFLDLNETGAAPQATNNLTKMNVTRNPVTIPGNPDPSGDVTGAEQAFINQGSTGGTLEANLGASTNLPVVAQGAGFADYAIFTGVNPFNVIYAATDVVLFDFSMDTLNNGAEEVFLSGEFAGVDVTAVPEPSACCFLGIVCAGLIGRRRWKKIGHFVR